MPVRTLTCALVPLLALTVQAQQLNCTALYPSTPSTPYPSQADICTTFSHLTGRNANYTAFFSHVSETVNWTIEGTHPLAGTYTNKTVLEAAFLRIDATGSKANPLTLSLTNIVGGGDEVWSVQELEVSGVCNNGLLFDNRYAWVTRWDANGTILQARAYLDSNLVATAIVDNEVGLFTYSDARKGIMPFVNLTPQELAAASGLESAPKNASGGIASGGGLGAGGGCWEGICEGA